MFTGTADGRVVKLESGEIETIARFGSGPCSKWAIIHSKKCHLWNCFSLEASFTLGEEEAMTIWQREHDVEFAFVRWLLDLTGLDGYPAGQWPWNLLDTLWGYTSSPFLVLWSLFWWFQRLIGGVEVLL